MIFNRLVHLLRLDDSLKHIPSHARAHSLQDGGTPEFWLEPYTKDLLIEQRISAHKKPVEEVHYSHTNLHESFTSVTILSPNCMIDVAQADSFIEATDKAQEDGGLKNRKRSQKREDLLIAEFGGLTPRNVMRPSISPSTSDPLSNRDTPSSQTNSLDERPTNIDEQNPAGVSVRMISPIRRSPKGGHGSGGRGSGRGSGTRGGGIVGHGGASTVIQSPGQLGVKVTVGLVVVVLIQIFLR